MSGFISGLGQILTGRVFTGVIWLVALLIGGAIALWLAISPRITSFVPFLICFGVLTAAWLAMLIDAYRGRPKSDNDLNRPWIAMILSAIIPGVGQLYNKTFLRFGIVLFGLIVAGLLFKWIGTSGFHLVVMAAILDAYCFHGRRGRPFTIIVAVVICSHLLSLAETKGIKAFVSQPFKVPTSTMLPTLHGIEQKPDGSQSIGDHVLADKISYRFREPRRGEIVVFRTTFLKDRGFDPRGEYYVKRIVALPGETVSICPPFVCIDGKPLSNPPIFKDIGESKDGYSGYANPSGFTRSFLESHGNSYQLGIDEYFVLGDNSRSSLDGRYWGALPRKDIVGRVTKIYWPLSRAGGVR
jgi:signal peptidase I